jgi:hypothetical protein
MVVDEHDRRGVPEDRRFEDFTRMNKRRSERTH